MNGYTGPCACMGPMYGEPLCPCRMEGLSRSEEYKNTWLPENVAKREEELKRVFLEMFARKEKKNV